MFSLGTGFSRKKFRVAKLFYVMHMFKAENSNPKVYFAAEDQEEYGIHCKFAESFLVSWRDREILPLAHRFQIFNYIGFGGNDIYGTLHNRKGETYGTFQGQRFTYVTVLLGPSRGHTMER